MELQCNMLPLLPLRALWPSGEGSWVLISGSAGVEGVAGLLVDFFLGFFIVTFSYQVSSSSPGLMSCITKEVYGHLMHVHFYSLGRAFPLKAKLLALGEWYSCRRLALVANSGVSTLGFKHHSSQSLVIRHGANKCRGILNHTIFFTAAVHVSN